MERQRASVPASDRHYLGMVSAAEAAGPAVRGFIISSGVGAATGTRRQLVIERLQDIRGSCQQSPVSSQISSVSRQPSTVSRQPSAGSKMFQSNRSAGFFSNKMHT